MWLDLSQNQEESFAGSLFLEKGVAGEGVPQVRWLPLGFSQCEHLLLRHTGWHGNMSLMDRVQGLLVGRDGTRVANC